MKPASAARQVTDSDKASDLRLVCRDSSRQLAALPPPVRQVASLFDGQRTIEDVVTQTQISAAKCRAVVRKLTEIGVLERVRPPRRPGFSEVEEAFFSAEVAPIDECDEPFRTLGDRVRAALCEVMVRLRRQQRVLG